MSMILCAKCSNIVDCDDYPEGFYRQHDGEIDNDPSDEFYCQSCNETD